MNWKVERDPFYNELYPLIGQKGIEEAGFFEDTATENVNIMESVKVLCTPLSFMSDRLATATNPCILLTTGSFCPVHQGHIQMMEKAKDYLELRGFQIVGGFISPGHDEYISAKNKEKATPVHYRIKEINDALKQYPWLSVDPWEGLFCKVAVNFTDVYERLRLYIQYHLKKDIPIFFVSGGDHARFAMTFIQKGHCVIVKRPFYEQQYETYSRNLSEKKNIHFIEGGNSLSSTELRINDFVPNEKKKLIIRVEDNDKKSILDILNSCFSSIEQKSLKEQKESFNNIQLEKVISLDSLLTSEQNLAISRSYDLFGIHLMGFTNRPGTPSIDEQISVIKQGEYSLFDDDIHTGSTMRFAKTLIEKSGSKVDKFISLNISSPENSEILDCRDFYLENENNGLVIKLSNGTTTRAPYIYPYVCPFVRASIDEPMKFSAEVWKMNMELFQESNLLLKDLPFWRPLFEKIGFSLEDSMYTICKWHYDLLTELC